MRILMMDEYKKCMYNDTYIYNMCVCVYICIYIYISYIYIMWSENSQHWHFWYFWCVCVCLKMVHRQFPWIGLSDNRFLASSLNSKRLMPPSLTLKSTDLLYSVICWKRMVSPKILYHVYTPKSMNRRGFHQMWIMKYHEFPDQSML